MTLQSSGPIDFGQINVELGLPATQSISLGDTNVRTLSGILTGPISMSNFYSASQGYGYGLFGGGYTTVNTNYTDKYTYSNNAVAAGTVLGLARYWLASCGSSTVGIFGGGYTTVNTNYTDKYTYSNNSVAAGTVLGLARYALAACGNSTVGIFGGGYTNVNINYTDKYTYSNNAVAPGTVLGLARRSLAAVSASPGHF